ncbi:MAG: hypothetical protein OHK0039_44190 [Bacteroidia bacterium]
MYRSTLILGWGKNHPLTGDLGTTVAWVGTLCAVVALSLSKAVLSVAPVLVALGAVMHGWQNRRAGRPVLQDVRMMGFVALFGLSLMAVFQTSTWPLWLNDLRQKVPFLVLGLAYACLPPFGRRQYYAVMALFVVAQSLVAVVSLLRFFGDYEAAMIRVAQNAHIDVMGSISHIYFGLLLAAAVLVGAYLVWRGEVLRFGAERYVLALLTLFNLVALHLFTARTGLLAFYVAVLLGGGLLVIQQRNWRLALALLVVPTALLAGSYAAIPSFRLRVQVSIWDLRGYRSPQQDISHHSASLRLIAWETAWKVFRQQPLLGTGMADVEADMRAVYARDVQRVATDFLPANPHNQYLEHLAGQGIAGLALLLLTCFWALRGHVHAPGVALLALFMAGMVTESLLERQIGMSFFVIFMALLPRYASQEANNDVAAHLSSSPSTNFSAS